MANNALSHQWEYVEEPEGLVWTRVCNPSNDSLWLDLKGADIQDNNSLSEPLRFDRLQFLEQSLCQYLGNKGMK